MRFLIFIFLFPLLSFAQIDLKKLNSSYYSDINPSPTDSLLQLYTNYPKIKEKVKKEIIIVNKKSVYNEHFSKDTLKIAKYYNNGNIKSEIQFENGKRHKRTDYYSHNPLNYESIYLKNYNLKQIKKSYGEYNSANKLVGYYTVSLMKNDTTNFTKRQFEFNPDFQPKKITDYSFLPSLIKVSEWDFTYNNLKNLLKVESDRNVIEYRYNNNKELIEKLEFFKLASGELSESKHSKFYYTNGKLSDIEYIDPNFLSHKSTIITHFTYDEQDKLASATTIMRDFFKNLTYYYFDNKLVKVEGLANDRYIGGGHISTYSGIRNDKKEFSFTFEYEFDLYDNILKISEFFNEELILTYEYFYEYYIN